jgi:hypothetical protein
MIPYLKKRLGNPPRHGGEKGNLIYREDIPVYHNTVFYGIPDYWSNAYSCRVPRSSSGCRRSLSTLSARRLSRILSGLSRALSRRILSCRCLTLSASALSSSCGPGSLQRFPLFLG